MMESELISLLGSGGTFTVFAVVGVFGFRYFTQQIAKQETQIKELNERIITKEADSDKKTIGMLKTLLELTQKENREFVKVVTNNTEVMTRNNHLMVELTNRVKAIEVFIETVVKK